MGCEGGTELLGREAALLIGSTTERRTGAPSTVGAETERKRLSCYDNTVMLSRHWRATSFALCLLLGGASLAHSQAMPPQDGGATHRSQNSSTNTPQTPATLAVTGDVPTPLALNAADLAAMPRAALTVKDDGVDVRYEGVWVHTILAKAGVKQGAELRGKALATGVLAEASDGYQVLVAIAEFDPAFRETQALLADRVDGKPLLPHQGPLRLVVPGEGRGARSVRMLTALRVISLSSKGK